MMTTKKPGAVLIYSRFCHILIPQIVCIRPANAAIPVSPYPVSLTAARLNLSAFSVLPSHGSSCISVHHVAVRAVTQGKAGAAVVVYYAVNSSINPVSIVTTAIASTGYGFKVFFIDFIHIFAHCFSLSATCCVDLIYRFSCINYFFYYLFYYLFYI